MQRIVRPLQHRDGLEHHVSRRYRHRGGDQRPGGPCRPGSRPVGRRGAFGIRMRRARPAGDLRQPRPSTKPPATRCATPPPGRSRWVTARSRLAPVRRPVVTEPGVNVFTAPWFYWSIIIAAGLPTVLVLLTELQLTLDRRQRLAVLSAAPHLHRAAGCVAAAAGADHQHLRSKRRRYASWRPSSAS